MSVPNGAPPPSTAATIAPGSIGNAAVVAMLRLGADRSPEGRPNPARAPPRV